MRKSIYGLLCFIVLSSGICSKEDSVSPPVVNGVPSITSISNTSGIIGDTVSIYGSNFSTTPSENTVKFDGNTARVISSTNNTIVVIVPAGTQTSKVNVTVSVNGQVGSTSQIFTVLSNNVYAIAYSTDPQQKSLGIIFKNENIAGYINSSAGSIFLNGLFVSGTDIYVSGSIFSNNIGTAAYWKNGVLTKLSDGLKSAAAFNIWVSGSDIYVAGGDENGMQYWKNGDLINLPIKGTYNSGRTNLIFVSGSDVYLCGVYRDAGNNQVVAYWKNGEEVFLPGSFPYPLSMFVSGGDVYVAGQTYTNTYNAVLWKNGVKSDLSDGKANFHASGVYVTGVDVYVSGYQSGVGGNSYPFYWKNGNKIDLSQNLGGSDFIAGKGDNLYISGNMLKTASSPEFGFWYNSTFTKYKIPAFTVSEIKGFFIQ